MSQLDTLEVLKEMSLLMIRRHQAELVGLGESEFLCSTVQERTGCPDAGADVSG